MYKIMSFFCPVNPFISTVRLMVDYVKKLFLSVSWVCRWRKYVRKHLQTHLRGPCTILHTQSDYFLHWIWDKKTHDPGISCTLKKTVPIIMSTTLGAWGKLKKTVENVRFFSNAKFLKRRRQRSPHAKSF